MQPRSPCGGVAAPWAHVRLAAAWLRLGPRNRSAPAGGRASWETSWNNRGKVDAPVVIVADLHLAGTAAVKEQGHFRELAQRQPRIGTRRCRGAARDGRASVPAGAVPAGAAQSMGNAPIKFFLFFFCIIRHGDTAGIPDTVSIPEAPLRYSTSRCRARQCRRTGELPSIPSYSCTYR